MRPFELLFYFLLYRHYRHRLLGNTFSPLTIFFNGNFRRFLMKMVAWLQQDSYISLVNRLRALKIDYGKGFTTELTQGPEQSLLKISSCFYQTIFQREEVPQLTSACCCSQDRVWLEGAPRTRVYAGLESSIAQGDTCCKFLVKRE